MAGVGKDTGKLPSIAEIQKQFWGEYGRVFFTRYDYEGISGEGPNDMVKLLQGKLADKDTVGSEINGRKIVEADDFSYTDLDGSVSKNQGIYFKFNDGSRIVVRLSGTGSSGATIRLYVEKHESDSSKFNLDAQDYLKSNVQLAVELLQLQKFIGRTEPDVKT